MITKYMISVKQNLTAKQTKAHLLPKHWSTRSFIRLQLNSSAQMPKLFNSGSRRTRSDYTKAVERLEAGSICHKSRKAFTFQGHSMIAEFTTHGHKSLWNKRIPINWTEIYPKNAHKYHNATNLELPQRCSLVNDFCFSMHNVASSLNHSTLWRNLFHQLDKIDHSSPIGSILDFNWQ